MGQQSGKHIHEANLQDARSRYQPQEQDCQDSRAFGHQLSLPQQSFSSR
jgi:hypothetical protein